MACRLVVGNAVVVALSAMHPHLHPTFRPPWYVRMRIQTLGAEHMSDRDSRTNLVATALATKEAVRRLLSTTMLSSPAMFHALAKLGHPVGLLTSPPAALPPKGMEGAMVAFVYAGIELQAGKSDDYAKTVLAAFERIGGSPSGMGFSWDASWLGMRAECLLVVDGNVLACHLYWLLTLLFVLVVQRQRNCKRPLQDPAAKRGVRDLVDRLPHQLRRLLGTLRRAPHPVVAPRLRASPRHPFAQRGHAAGEHTQRT